MWGTYGKGGVEHCAGRCPKHQLRLKRLIDCSTQHLQMILKNQRHIYDYPVVLAAIHAILAKRGVKPANFSFHEERKMFDAMNKALKKFSNSKKI